MFNLLRLIIISGLLTSLSVNAEPKKQSLDSDISNMREIISNRRLDHVQAYMGISAFEEKQFLGVYNRYRDEMQPILDEQAKLVTDYINAYQNKKITDQFADKITRTMLELAAKKVAVRKQFVSEFQEFLKPRAVARFMQLENKLDAIMSYDLARKIPLVPTDKVNAPTNIKLQ